MLEWPSSKIQELGNVGEDVEKREPLYTARAAGATIMGISIDVSLKSKN